MKILLAIDGTKESKAALEAISKLNAGSMSEIRILTVIDMALPLAHDIYTGMIANTIEIEQAARAAAEESLEKTKSSVEALVSGSDVSVITQSVVGSPESSIVEAAEEMDADLIILGSHGYSRWERLLLGSVSDSVIHHAPCSVLVVRSGGVE